MMISNPTKLTSTLKAEEDKLLACVHCGLCLEACPTYIHTNDENDSPRGRIYLMRAVEEKRLASESIAFARHISRCLGCRACEQACPAGVQYGQLLEAARSDLSQVDAAQRGLPSRMLRFVLRHIWLHPARLRAAFAVSRSMRDAGLARLLLRSRIARLISPRLEFALALLDGSSPIAWDDANKNKLRAQEANESNSPVNELTRALLFTGCVTEGLFARVNRAAARVLAANNCVTHVPAAQGCCGALHAHAGDLEGARRLARRNIEAFEGADGAAIVTNAGGCGAMLASYGHLFEDDPEYAARARAFSARVRDVSQQLEATGVRCGAELDENVTTYDASCHLLYGQRAGEAPLRILDAIPGLDFSPLEGSEVCCGGAGVYNLIETELSSRVLSEKLTRIRETGARTVATGNPGCHMQIAAGARLSGLSLKLCHPIELLDESYRRAGIYKTVTSDE